MIHRNSFRRSHRAARLGVQISIAALVATLPALAHAQCSPDPTQTGKSVICSGTDSNGITITTNASPLSVASGAQITNSGASAITVAIPVSATTYYRNATITVDGAVSATGGAGINVLSGPLGTSSYDYYGTLAAITVNAGATVSGTYGIVAGQSTGGFYGTAQITLDNAGTISGTSGVALATTGNYANFNSILNRATGTIGAIQASVNSITNEGTIAGGALSAIAGAANTYGTVTNKGTISSANGSGTILNYSGPITNSGTIINTGTGSAVNALYLNLTNLAGGSITGKGSSVLIVNPTSSLTVTNSGSITNSGSGTVLNGGTVSLTNNAGGTISTGAGGTAIYADMTLNLTNAGTINGNVVVGLNGSTYSYSSIDSTAGTITGNLTLGNGNDTLVATLKNGSLYTGITGTINGGAGNNTIRLVTTSDATLTSGLTLPSSFSLMEFAPNSGTTLTLGKGFANSGTISFTGAGTLDNQTALSGSGTIVNSSNYSAYSTFKNSGSISSSNAGGNPALSLSGYTNLVNTGTISATGMAVNTGIGGVTNSGTITAGGTAVSSFFGSGTFNNSGTIRSTGGTGAALSFSCTCSTGTNSGTISGAQIGVAMSSGILVNTGTIQSDGTAFQIGFYSTLDNRAGGVITGGSMAVDGLGYLYNDRVSNAGTINGNVNLGSASSYNSNTYYAVTGGVLNGNLTLGQGDTLITDLINTGKGAFAGINGTVNASNSKLIYNVASNASGTTSLATGFTSLGYQLSNNATLSLAGQGALASTLTLAGTGSVNLTGSLSSNAGPVIQTTYAQTPTGGSDGSAALTITNNGSIALTRISSSSYPQSALVLGQIAGLVNNGSITVSDNFSANNSGISAVTLYGSLTNTGTISATGAQGVLIGGTWSFGNTPLVNSGRISADGLAVGLYGAVAITNSGVIASSGTAAIGDFASSSSVTNLAGGSISGVGAAIQMYGGTVSNAGTINGNVSLGYSAYGYTSYNAGTYVANGGTLNGNLTFGSGNDLLVETGSGFGVTGTINSGSGTNTLGHQRSGTATVTLGGALPTGFSQELTVAAGTGSRVTLTGPSAYTSNIYVGGDGTIINQLATTGGVYGPGYGGITYSLYASSELAGFVNRANVGTVSLNTGTFDNSATIGSSSVNGNAVALSTATGFSFTNSGTILNKGTNPAVSFYGSANTASSTIANSGTINGGISASIAGAADTTVNIANSGTITSYTQAYYTFTPTPPYYTLTTSNYALTAYANGAKSLNLNNSGTITGDIALTGAPVSLTNSGTIVGNIFTGTGNDAFAFGGTFAGGLNGGAGTNTLAINAGNQNFSSILNIAALTQSGGFASVSGIATLGTVGMTGGRLVGLGGSVINAPSIAVGSGATFGSAGTVNGNITVSGILSPGASPGTMTVNGNVTLNSGSTSLFEITPTAADKLIVNGRLVIASGSTLQIAATTPIKAGSTLNLISASGGVAGSYDTVTGLPGVVKVQANGDLGLLVQFANSSGYNPQVQRAISYVNNAMAASNAPAALFPALLALQDGNGAPIASAFARVTPEAYADAMQIGTETALSLAATTRMLGEGETSGPAHVFSFGQMMGSMRQFTGQPMQGINRATINGYGALGGIGVAGQGYALSAYVGWMDQNQSVGAIAASTQARGVVGGLALRLGDRATRVTLSASYDAARARTLRDVPDAGQIVGSYALPTVSLDASVSHAFALSQGWQVRPHVGGTWVMTRHGAMTEASAHPFALSVDEASRKQGFIDAGLGFESPAEAKGPWRRFLTLGMRYRLESDPVGAAAALAGNGYGLVAYGVERDRFTATGAVGVEYQVAPAAVFFLNASGELGETGKRESVMGGLRWRM